MSQRQRRAFERLEENTRKKLAQQDPHGQQNQKRGQEIGTRSLRWQSGLQTNENVALKLTLEMHARKCAQLIGKPQDRAFLGRGLQLLWKLDGLGAGSMTQEARRIEEGGKADTFVKTCGGGEEGLDAGKLLKGNAGGQSHFELLHEAGADGIREGKDFAFESLLYVPQAQPTGGQGREQKNHETKNEKLPPRPARPGNFILASPEGGGRFGRRPGRSQLLLVISYGHRSAPLPRWRCRTAVLLAAGRAAGVLHPAPGQQLPRKPAMLAPGRAPP